MRRLLALMSLVTVFTSIPAPARAHFQQDAAAAAMAEYLSYLESTGDANGLFDLIHPDAHAIIPRAAVIGWYENDFFPLGPAVAEAYLVEFKEWIWPVTGQVYPVTAEVSFTQAFADGSIADEKVRLVQDEYGTWRWFFGRSMEFVQTQIDRYASVPKQTVYETQDPVRLVANQLDAFWTTAFSANDRTFVPPAVVSVIDDPVDTQCVTVEPGDLPGLYCQLDRTIVVDILWFSFYEETFGDFAWITILAHEYGHAVQHQANVPQSPDSSFELQADCLAGAFARDAETLGLLNEGDVLEAVTISAASGDPVGLPQDQAGAHGTPEDRLTEFMRGFLDGFIGCNLGFTDDAVTSEGSTQAERSAGAADFVPYGISYRSRTLDEVVANYTDPTATEQRFRDAGWVENVVAKFETDPGQEIYLSVHRFETAVGASTILDWSINDQAASTDALPADAPGLGDRDRAIIVNEGFLFEYTVYVQVDNVLIRLTVTGSMANEMDVAGEILRDILVAAA